VLPLTSHARKTAVRKRKSGVKVRYRNDKNGIIHCKLLVKSLLTAGTYSRKPKCVVGALKTCSNRLSAKVIYSEVSLSTTMERSYTMSKGSPLRLICFWQLGLQVNCFSVKVMGWSSRFALATLDSRPRRRRSLVEEVRRLLHLTKLLKIIACADGDFDSRLSGLTNTVERCCF